MNSLLASCKASSLPSSLGAEEVARPCRHLRTACPLHLLWHGVSRHEYYLCCPDLSAKDLSWDTQRRCGLKNVRTLYAVSCSSDTASY